MLIRKIYEYKRKNEYANVFFCNNKTKFQWIYVLFCVIRLYEKKISNKSQYLEHFDEQSNNFVENMSIHK